MTSQNRNSIIGILAAVLIGAFVAWAGSDGSTEVGWTPVFALCALLAYVINWVVFIPSNRAKTEHYFDLTGSVTYLSVTVVALLLSDDLQMRGARAGRGLAETCLAALAAGVDFLLVGNNLAHEEDDCFAAVRFLEDAVARDVALAERAHAALTRVRAARSARA